MTYVADGNLARRGALQRKWSDEAGFSLHEIFLVASMIGVIVVMAMFGLGNAVSMARSRGAVAQVKLQLANARELAISQQRDIRIEFNEPDEIRVIRINRPSSEGETVLSTARLEGNMFFSKIADLPETPDAWGGDDAIAFGDAETLRFRSGDGALVDEADEIINGRVFVHHRDGRFESAGVVSIFGATGRIRSYRSMGESWE